MKDKHPIDEFFKKGLEDHKTNPSPSVWDKIDGEIGQSKKSRGGWYFMRAAVLTLFVALSTYVFYQNEGMTFIVEDPVENKGNENKGNQEKVEGTQTNSQKQESKGRKTEAAPAKEKKSKKVVPIMNTGNRIYVSKEESGEKKYIAAIEDVADEEQLFEDTEETELLSLNLDERLTEETPQPKLRVKVKLSPVTGNAFYADNDSTGTEAKEKLGGLKEKLYAYASDQFGNLVNGKPLELPKSEKKPQLEINLDRIF